MKKTRLRKILFISGIIIISILLLSISLNEHAIRPKKTIYVSLCILPASVSYSTINKSIRNELDKKAAGFDLRITSYKLDSGSRVEDLLLELAQKQCNVIYIINYINPGLHRKLAGLYPGIDFVFIGSFLEVKVLYKHIDTFLYRIKNKP